jgi:amino acid permease
VYIGIFVLVTFAPLTWVRKIEKFRYGFIFGVAMILVAVLTISGFCYSFISKRDYIRPQSGYFAINMDRYWDMIGFSFFMFEGIGSVMPVMNACDEKAK